jgi:alcohol dehydrogenase class IV
MVNPFQFARLPKIYFGTGKITDLPRFITEYGKSVLLVTGKQSFKNSLYYINLIGSFESAGIQHYDVTIQGEPSPDIIDHTVEAFREKVINVVVGVGGGSVLDAGKAISAMLYRSEPVKYFLETVGSKEHPGTKVPYIAVPTTSGTGSEATKNAVISQIGKDGFKRSLRHDNFVPDIAIVDPDLTLKFPPDLTAASGMDCFTQLTESYLSDKGNEYTDALAWKGLEATRDSLIKCYANGEDIEARSDMSFAALTSGICLANAGLGVVHGFASSIGGMYNIPHGLICGTLMATSNEITVRESRKKRKNRVVLNKYASLGRLFIGGKGKSDDYYIDGFIQYLHKLTIDLQLPGLNKLGLKEEDIKLICSVTDNKNNPIGLSQDDLIEIISCRFN